MWAEGPADYSMTYFPLHLVAGSSLEVVASPSSVVAAVLVAGAAAQNCQHSAGVGVAGRSPNAAAESSHLEEVAPGTAVQHFHTFLVGWEGVEIGCFLVAVVADVGRGTRRNVGSFFVVQLLLCVLVLFSCRRGAARVFSMTAKS